MEDNVSGDDVDEGHKGAGEFVVASGGAPEFFDSAKEPLHLLPHPVFLFVIRKESLPHRSGRDDGLNALMFQESTNVIAIIGFVHHHGVQPT